MGQSHKGSLPIRTLYEVDDSVQVVQMTVPADVEALLALFGRVAEEQDWQPGNALQAYVPYAEHLAVLVGGEVAGGLQAVPGTAPVPPPHQAVWPEVDAGDPARRLHVTVMALAPEHRGSARLFWPLCVELWRRCAHDGIETILLEATLPTLRVYRRLGWPLEVIGDRRRHWGEECVLCRLDVGRAAEAITDRARRCASYGKLVAQGRREALPER